eukprot:PITA_33385
MADEMKDKGAGDPIKILLEEALERQRNAMMDNFAQILQRLPRGDPSASNSYSGNATPFKYYPVKSYKDKYIKWTTLRQGREQDVSEFTNIFHTLRTQLGIKDSELHLLLKYGGCLHRYIQEEMEFLNISSLGTTYRYAVKIEQEFKQKKRDFGSANLKPKGQSKGGVTQENLSKPQEKNNTMKPKKDTRKWCEFHKSPTHNKTECWTKQSLVAELKASESDTCSNPEPEPDKGNGKGKQIIDADPNATIATAKIQKNEPEDPKEGERLFHSQMWVKGSSLQFIFDSGSQKNLISAEVVKRLGLPTTTHPQPYNIGWLHEGRDLKVRQQCRLPYSIKPFTDEVLCDFTPLDVCDVLLGQP